MDQLLKTGIKAKRIQAGIDLEIQDPLVSSLKSAVKPGESVLLVPQPCIDKGNFIPSNAGLLDLLLQLIDDNQRVGDPSLAGIDIAKMAQGVRTAQLFEFLGRFLVKPL